MTENAQATQTTSLVEGSTDTKQISIAEAPVGKKIGFFSAMMVVVGSSVGAGIFFKQATVMANSFGSQIFSIFTWLLAAFGVIAMALALVEIASARNDNLSLIGWCKAFNSRFIYKMCKNFMFYIYLPLTYFFMPLYVIMSFQDGVRGFGGGGTFGGKGDWAIAMVVAILMSLYFIVVSGISSKAGNIQNWIVTSLKFIPLVFAAIIGFVIIGMEGTNGYTIHGEYVVGPSAGFDPGNFETDPNSFQRMSPGIGLFVSVGAIFFAYDGFYVTAGIQSEMKEPKKTPLAILFGLILVTVIYLLLAVSLSVANPQDGSPTGVEAWLGKYANTNGVNWVYGLFQILIGVGVLGIINGFAMWAPRFTEDLIREGELPLSAKYASKLNANKPWVGIIYNIVISVPIVVLFCIVGGLGYIDVSGYGAKYGDGMGQLYSFCDLMGTWTAVIAFAFIMIAIFGGIQNRKTNRLVTDKKSYFLPMAWSSVIVVGLALFFTFIKPFIDMFMLYQMATTTIKQELVVGGTWTSEIVSRILTVIMFFLFLALMILPTLIEDIRGKKKYGSIEAFDEAKAAEIANIIGESNPEEVSEPAELIEEPAPVENETWDVVNREPIVDQEPVIIKEPVFVSQEPIQEPIQEPVFVNQEPVQETIEEPYAYVEEDDGECNCEFCQAKRNELNNDIQYHGIDEPTNDSPLYEVVAEPENNSPLYEVVAEPENKQEPENNAPLYEVVAEPENTSPLYEVVAGPEFGVNEPEVTVEEPVVETTYSFDDPEPVQPEETPVQQPEPEIEATYNYEPEPEPVALNIKKDSKLVSKLSDDEIQRRATQSFEVDTNVSDDDDGERTIMVSLDKSVIEKMVNDEKEIIFFKRLPIQKVKRVLIYSNKPIGKVIGEFDLKDTQVLSKSKAWATYGSKSTLTKKQFDEYFKDQKSCKLMEVEGLILYPRTRSLEDFKLSKAPPSFCYLK